MRASSSNLLRGLLALAVLAGPASAQRAAPWAEIAPLAGVSLRQSPTGFRVAKDVLAYGIRVELPRTGFQPWLEVTAFDRPDLECVEGLPCNDGGWAIRGGVLAYLSPMPYAPGPQPRLMAGLGAAFSEETALSYVLGLGMDWRIGRVLAPFLDARWEHLPGIDTFMMNAGLKVAIPRSRRDAEEGA